MHNGELIASVNSKIITTNLLIFQKYLRQTIIGQLTNSLTKITSNEDKFKRNKTFSHMLDLHVSDF